VAHLIKEFGLESNQIYKLSEGFEYKVIIKKQGMDRIERQLEKKEWSITTYYEESVPYGDKAYAIVQAVATKLQTGRMIRALAGANPDNCRFPNFVEVAEKRARYRVLLRAANLSEFFVYAQDESEGFMPPEKGTEIAAKAIDEAYSHAPGAVKFDKEKLDKEANDLKIKIEKKKADTKRRSKPAKGDDDPNETDKAKGDGHPVRKGASGSAKSKVAKK